MVYSSKTVKFGCAVLVSVSMAQIANAGESGYNPSLVPSGANVGECYVRVKIPAQYSVARENVKVEEAYSTVEVEQPVLVSREQQVLVKEPSVRYEVRQPRYTTVTEQMLVRPAYDKLSVTPPQFKEVTETIQISQPRTVWKRGNPGKLAAQGYTVLSVANGGVLGRGFSSTTQYGAQSSASQCGELCEIWCLVEEPGESRKYSRRVMTSGGDVRRTPMPAKYTPISKQVVADPGGVREIPIQAEYRSFRVEDLLSPGGERYVNVPAKYGSVPKKTLVEPERFEWRRAICKPGTLGSGASSYSSGAASSGYVSGSSITYGSTGTSYGGHSGSISSGGHLSSAPTGYYSSGASSLQNYEGVRETCSGSNCNHAATTAYPAQVGSPDLAGGSTGRSYYYGSDMAVNK